MGDDESWREGVDVTNTATPNDIGKLIKKVRIVVRYFKKIMKRINLL